MIIRGADVLGSGRTDLGVRDGRLVEIADVASDHSVIDADGLIALPGLVDLHTHLREPGREDAETVLSGTRAAARGGFTAVLAMANTSPVTDTAEAADHVAALGRRGDAQVVPVGAVSKGLAGAELAELGLMARSDARVRVFSDDGHCVADARLMRRALEYVRAFDGVIAQHAQDPRLASTEACAHEGEVSGRLGLPGWPAAAESTIVARDVELARLTRSRLHVCHVSTAETVEVLRWAKGRGIDVTAEVAPHHLLLTVAELEGYDPTYKVNPPLRPTTDIEALWAAPAEGTIDCIATEHAPHA
ncbi:MAG: dihydroorotase, partial [Propionibacteriaceae bacterium]